MPHLIPFHFLTVAPTCGCFGLGCVSLSQRIFVIQPNWQTESSHATQSAQMAQNVTHLFQLYKMQRDSSKCNNHLKWQCQPNTTVPRHTNQQTFVPLIEKPQLSNTNPKTKSVQRMCGTQTHNKQTNTRAQNKTTHPGTDKCRGTCQKATPGNIDATQPHLCSNLLVWNASSSVSGSGWPGVPKCRWQSTCIVNNTPCFRQMEMSHWTTAPVLESLGVECVFVCFWIW